jgi:hypothetical protein
MEPRPLMNQPHRRNKASVSAPLRWVSALAIALALATQALADSPLSALKTLSILPRTESEIATAHERSRGQACEHLGAGEALEISSFIPEFVGDRFSGQGELPVPTSRRAAFSVGTDMDDADQSDLPLLTRGKILEYLDTHYVCVDIRVQRDLDSGEFYLHHRPLAATATFAGARLTKEFTDLVSDSVQNMRSLGLLVSGGAKETPETYRTLVMVHKSMMSTTQTGKAAEKGKPIYEFIFVQGRPNGKEGLELHAFATTQERRRLNYLRPFNFPKRPQDCAIRGTIRFTDYKVANLLPAESITRRTTVKSQASFAWEDLNAYAAAQGWRGGAYDHLAKVLDAIIDRKLSPSVD